MSPEPKSAHQNRNEYYKKWRQTDSGRASTKKSMSEYFKSPKGTAAIKKYQTGEKGTKVVQAAIKKCQTGEKGTKAVQAATNKYLKTPSGRAADTLKKFRTKLQRKEKVAEKCLTCLEKSPISMILLAMRILLLPLIILTNWATGQY